MGWLLDLAHVLTVCSVLRLTLLLTSVQIVHHVKDYIIKHQLFDKADPSIVHCGQDKLGMVFRVSSFTVNDAVWVPVCMLQKDLSFVHELTLWKQTSRTYEVDFVDTTLTICLLLGYFLIYFFMSSSFRHTLHWNTTCCQHVMHYMYTKHADQL